MVIPTSTTSTGAPRESIEKLAKAMEDMFVHSEDIKRLRNQLNDILEQLKGKESAHATELQINKKLNEILQKSY